MTYLFSSNTSATIINEVEIKNDAGNAVPISKNTETNSNSNPIFVKGTADTSFFAPTQTDAFGRLRVSNPFTIFDNSFTIGDNIRVFDTSNTAGTSCTFEANTSSVQMVVDNTSGHKVYRQTKRYFQYQPGKSLLSMNTFVMNSGKANLRQRVGYFDTQNGIFIENSDNVTYIVKRSFVTGSVVDTKIAQSNWSVDTLQGTGPSSKNLDISKAQIFWSDIEWLGVGSVRAGFVIDGEFQVCHQFNHANIESNVYMTTATLPVRYEIENTGTTSGSSTLKHICNTVISEGGYAPTVVTRSAATELSGLNMSQTDFRPLLALRLKSGQTNNVVLPVSLNLHGLQSTAFAYKIIQTANVIGGTWETTGTDSIVQYNANATSLGTGGYDLMQGIFLGGTSGQALQVDLRQHNHSLQLTGNINGSPEVFCVAVKATTNNDDALGSISWEEYN
jgi:hypothetical protein